MDKNNSLAVSVRKRVADQFESSHHDIAPDVREAFVDGMDARVAGAGLDENPHLIGSQLRAAWFSGWSIIDAASVQMSGLSKPAANDGAVK